MYAIRLSIGQAKQNFHVFFPSLLLLFKHFYHQGNKILLKGIMKEKRILWGNTSKTDRMTFNLMKFNWNGYSIQTVIIFHFIFLHSLIVFIVSKRVTLWLFTWNKYLSNHLIWIFFFNILNYQYQHQKSLSNKNQYVTKIKLIMKIIWNETNMLSINKNIRFKSKYLFIFTISNLKWMILLLIDKHIG